MRKKEQGTVELIVIGLIAALLVVLAIPLFSGDFSAQPIQTVQQ